MSRMLIVVAMIGICVPEAWAGSWSLGHASRIQLAPPGTAQRREQYRLGVALERLRLPAGTARGLG